MGSYYKYRRLKKLLSGQFIRKYPLDRVLGSHLALYVWLPVFGKIRFLVSLLRWRHEVKCDTELLITFTQGSRQDYKELLSFFETRTRDKKSQTVFLTPTLRKPMGYADFCKRFATELVKKNDVNCVDHFILCYLRSIAHITIEELEDQNLDCNEYLAFNSAYLMESFLTFYFRIRGVPTGSLQHAMYFDYLNDPPLDIINYENACAETLFCWGQFSLDQIEASVPHDVNLVVDNYPRNVTTRAKRCLSNCILVLLPRWIYRKEIGKILRQIAESSLSFTVRPHPGSISQVRSLSRYLSNIQIEDSKSLSASLAQTLYKACVGFNSSALFEALLYEQRTIQYLCGNEEFLIPEIPKISSLMELENLPESNISEETLDYYFSRKNNKTS
ncbi:MAG: hypothetical protein CMF52_05685 [Legionellales bacterium]|nr:hypothetical protein [Legionellales bacterium]